MTPMTLQAYAPDHETPYTIPGFSTLYELVPRIAAIALDGRPLEGAYVLEVSAPGATVVAPFRAAGAHVYRPADPIGHAMTAAHDTDIGPRMDYDVVVMLHGLAGVTSRYRQGYLADVYAATRPGGVLIISGTAEGAVSTYAHNVIREAHVDAVHREGGVPGPWGRGMTATERVRRAGWSTSSPFWRYLDCEAWFARKAGA